MTQHGRSVPFGAIFDWDGVIIDSAKLHERSWHQLASELGKAVAPGSFVRGFGMRNEQIIPEIHGWTHDANEIARLSDRKEELYRAIVGEGGIAPLPGVRAWLNALTAAKIPRAVASSTHRLNIETILDVLGLDQSFDAIVTAEDVSRGKPDPEVFLLGATRLGMAPSRCVVFEDAHVGINAARAAQMLVVAVTTTHPRAELTAADLIVDRLDELTVDQITQLFGRGRDASISPAAPRQAARTLD